MVRVAAALERINSHMGVWVAFAAKPAYASTTGARSGVSSETAFKKRDKKNNSTLHRLDDEYTGDHIMKRESGPTFKEFIHGKIDREELSKRMDQIQDK